jgi:hypothetical protein
MVGLGEEPDMSEEKWARVRKQFPAMPDDLEEAVFGVKSHSLVALGTCQAALMFGSVSPAIDETDVLTSAQQLVELYAPGAQSAYLNGLIREYPVDKSSDSPWDQGYELAEEVLTALSALPLLDADQQWIDIDTVYTKLSIKTRPIELHDKEIRAVAIASGPWAPVDLERRANAFAAMFSMPRDVVRRAIASGSSSFLVRAS